MVGHSAGSWQSSRFQARIAQAISAAQRSARYVALLVAGFESDENTELNKNPVLLESLEKAWLGLNGLLRDSDAVCRLNQAQTAVLLQSLVTPEDAVLVAKKIVERLEEPLLSHGLRTEIQPRIGVALFPDHSSEAAGLLHCAELALTTSRKTKQPYAVYSLERNNGQHPPIRLSDLRRAIIEDELFLNYQPKVNLKTQNIGGLEVLTRWAKPEYGLVLPDDFIPVAERTGLIVPLTLWVLHRALVQCRCWTDLGFDVTVAVNLSMWNLDGLELPRQIDGLLKSIDISPDRLELEITESAIMEDPQRAIRTLNLIRSLGVRFTIDDFGTGYSSLTHLKKLPVSCIKIDKSFVQNMETDKDDAVIVRSIVDLGHNLGLKVIAEGVETLQVKNMLTQFGCDEAQGYFLSHPIGAPQITRLLQKSGSRNGHRPKDGSAESPTILSNPPSANMPIVPPLLDCK